jgi:DNA-binding HxlR family transcriptional regulator
MLSERLAELCDAGRALLPALEQITRWAERYLPEPSP